MPISTPTLMIEVVEQPLTIDTNPATQAKCNER
jgi:hypothetical protein